jgi:galactonate dehydratase
MTYMEPENTTFDSKPYSRRRFIERSLVSAVVLPATLQFPFLGCSNRRMLTLEFLTIPDPDGWHPSLRLKGDWLIFKISDGVHSGYGEASHSKQDESCQRAAESIFQKHIASFKISLDSLKSLEQEVLSTSPDFVTATAWSGINQALYDLLAKREQVPVWQLFKSKPGLQRLLLYTTINRALKSRTHKDYLELAGKVSDQGFKIFKCAPFEKVVDPGNTVESSKAGLETLGLLRTAFPDTGIRVDFHERFSPENFYKLLPALEALNLDWVEEPFGMGDDYTELQKRTQLRIAGGELFWGTEIFRNIMEHRWVHVIMPDVKHVGGFGPLLNVLEMGKNKIGISPHNPSGPVSSAASLHAAALYPEIVHSLEYAFDSADSRQAYGEQVENGYLYLNDKPGWGIEPELMT